MEILKNKLFWSRIFLVWVIALVVLNIIPNFTPESLIKEDSDIFRTDYIQHFLSFLALPVFYSLSGRRTFVDRYTEKLWLIIFCGILFAATTESLQIIVPGRSFNPVDLILNISGLITGIIIIVGLNKIKVKIKKQGKELLSRKNLFISV